MKVKAKYLHAKNKKNRMRKWSVNKIEVKRMKTIGSVKQTA